MKSFRFQKIDAFTGPGSPGNPAGCVYLDPGQSISDAEMLEIARQLKGFVSEVAYVFAEGESCTLRYFSSEREVDFCGHATVAVMHEAFAGGGLFRGKSNARIRVGKRELDVTYDADTGVFIEPPTPSFLRVGFEEEEACRALGIELADRDGKYPVSVVNSGLTTLLMPLRQASCLCDVLPDFETLKTFCEKYSLDIVLLFTDDRIIPGSNYRTRVFAPRFGYLEDPATGSGNAALGHWLLREGFWKGGSLVIEQGRSYKAPNIVRLKTVQNAGVQKLLFGGKATVRINGEYRLQ